MKYNKLVRDKIPTYIRKKGGKPVYHVATRAEYWKKLKEKLHEEIKEFVRDESPEEFADLLEVLGAIANYKKFDRKRIAKLRAKKVKERGRFEKRIVLDEA